MGDENNSTFQGVETQMARLSLQEVTNHHSVIPPPDRAASSAATTATSRDPSISPRASLDAPASSLTWQQAGEEVKMKKKCSAG